MPNLPFTPEAGAQPVPVVTGANYFVQIPAVTADGYILSIAGKEDKVNKGVANGYAPLDATGKVPAGNLPDTASLDAEVDGKITTHNSATTSVHGIANTANLVSAGIINADKIVQFQDTEFNTLTEISGASVSVDGGGSYAAVGPTEVIVENVSGGKAVAINTDKIKLYTYVNGVGGANIFLQGTASGADKTITLPNATGTVALTGHTHTISDVTGLQTAIDSGIKAGVQWTTRHTNSTGNPYKVGSIVYHKSESGVTISGLTDNVEAEELYAQLNGTYSFVSRTNGLALYQKTGTNHTITQLRTFVIVEGTGAGEIIWNLSLAQFNSTGEFPWSGGWDNIGTGGGSAATAVEVPQAGRIYRCLNENDSVEPTQGGNEYWADLGAGYLLPNENPKIVGGSINTSGGGNINTSNGGGSINISGASDPAYAGGSLNMSAGMNGAGGSINTSNGGGSISLAGSQGASAGSISMNAGVRTELGYGAGDGGNSGSINLSGANNSDGSGGNGGHIDLHGGTEAGHGGSILLNGSQGSRGGSITSIGGGVWSANQHGGSLNMSSGSSGSGGSIDTSNGGGSINTKGVGSIQLGISNTRTTLNGSASGSNKTITLPNANGTIALTGHTHTISDVTGLQTAIDNSGIKAGVQWTTRHTTSTGNPYAVGSIVYHNGRVYRCTASNDSIEPGGSGNPYWADLGVGYLLPNENPLIVGGTINTSSYSAWPDCFDETAATVLTNPPDYGPAQIGLGRSGSFNNKPNYDYNGGEFRVFHATQHWYLERETQIISTAVAGDEAYPWLATWPSGILITKAQCLPPNAGGSINASGGARGAGGVINISNGGGSITSQDGGGSILLNGVIGGTDEPNSNSGSINLSALASENSHGGNITSNGTSGYSGGTLNMSAGGDGAGGSINTQNDGGSINTSDGGGSIITNGDGGSINTSSTGGSINTGGSGGSIDTSGGGGSINLTTNGGSINLSGHSHPNYGGSITATALEDRDAGSLDMSAGAAGAGGNIDTSNGGGSINTSGGEDGGGGSINTSNGGGSINTRGVGSIQLGETSTRTTLVGPTRPIGYANYPDEAYINVAKTITFPNATGTVALTSDVKDTSLHYLHNYAGVDAGYVITNIKFRQTLSGSPWTVQTSPVTAEFNRDVTAAKANPFMFFTKVFAGGLTMYWNPSDPSELQVGYPMTDDDQAEPLLTVSHQKLLSSLYFPGGSIGNKTIFNTYDVWDPTDFSEYLPLEAYRYCEVSWVATTVKSKIIAGRLVLGNTDRTTTIQASATSAKTITLPNATGTVALKGDSSHLHGRITGSGRVSSGGALQGTLVSATFAGTPPTLLQLPISSGSGELGYLVVQDGYDALYTGGVGGYLQRTGLNTLEIGVDNDGENAWEQYGSKYYTGLATIAGWPVNIVAFDYASQNDKPTKTDATGLLVTGDWGTTSGTFCQGNDARLNLVFDLYKSGVDIGRTSFWSSQFTLPANIAELTGGLPCLVTDISCIVTNRMGTGTLFITPPSFSLENIAGNGGMSHSSALSIGNKPLVGTYSRNTNEVGASKPSGKAVFTAGGNLFVNSATLPVYLANSLVNVIDGTQTTMTQNSSSIFSASDTYVKIDNEIVLITNGGAGLTPTIVRGQLGTAPATHGSGAIISTNIGSAGGGLLAKICFTFKRVV